VPTGPACGRDARHPRQRGNRMTRPVTSNRAHIPAQLRLPSSVAGAWRPADHRPVPRYCGQHDWRI